MSELLSDEWFEAVNAALASSEDDDPVGEPVTTEVELVVTGLDGGPVATRWFVEGGRLASVRPASPGDQPVDTTAPIAADDLRTVLAGEDDAAIRYMRGDLKPEGRTADVLALVAALARPACREALAGSLDG